MILYSPGCKQGLAETFAGTSLLWKVEDIPDILMHVYVMLAIAYLYSSV